MSTIRPLSAERDALNQLLGRLMSEEMSLENLCKHVPRVVSVSANVARIQDALESKDNEATDNLLKALAELTDEEVDEEVAW